MPYKDPQARKAYEREYREKNREKLAEQKKLIYEEKLGKYRGTIARNNQKIGHKPRPKGDKALPEIHVPVSRRWRYLNGKIYWTSKRGFTVAEVKEVLREVKKALEELIQAPPASRAASHPGSSKPSVRRSGSRT